MSHSTSRTSVGPPPVQLVQASRGEGYFISGGSAPLEEGRTIEWLFAHVGGKLDVTVIQLERPHRIAFEWSASGTPAQVEMTFQAERPDKAAVRITEAGWPTGTSPGE